MYRSSRHNSHTHHHVVSATALSSTLHFRHVVSVLSLPEMPVVRHNVAKIACGGAAHTFCSPGSPTYVSLPGWGLSRMHSVGRPLCTPRQFMATRKSFYWVDVMSLQVALGSLPLFLPLRDTVIHVMFNTNSTSLGSIQPSCYGIRLVNIHSLTKLSPRDERTFVYLECILVKLQLINQSVLICVTPHEIGKTI